MGRSRIAFQVPQAHSVAVLDTAVSYGAEHKMQLLQAIPNQVVLSKGNELLKGRQMVVVTSWDAPAGAQLAVEAGTQSEPSGEHSADPNPPEERQLRKDISKFLPGLLEQLGVPEAASVLRHS